MERKEKKVNIKIPERMHQGNYANMMVVSHTREEFILDFIMLTPPQGTVTSRVICSPGHVKRIIATLQDNMKKYEEIHGVVMAADDPGEQIGFTRQ